MTSRELGGSRRDGIAGAIGLPIATLVVAGFSFVLSACWLLLGWIVSVLAECLAPACL